jgi:hypothetical protein
MKSILLFFTFLHCFIFTYAQKLKVTVGPEITTTQVIKLMEIPKWKPVKVADLIPDGHFFDIRSRRTFTKFAFSKKNFMYNENFISPSGNKAFIAEVGEKESEKISVLRLLNQNNRLFIIYQKPNDKDGKYSVYINEIDKDLKVLGTPILIHTFNHDASSAEIRTTISHDQKRFMLYRYVLGLKQQQLLEYKMLDENFSEVASKLVELDDKENDVELEVPKIDNLGNIYLLASRRNDVDKNFYSVVLYYSTATGLKVHRIGLDDGKNFGIHLKIVNGIKPYVVGLNKNDKEVRYFISSLDNQTGMERDLGSQRLPKDFYQAANKGGYETTYWRVANIVGLENGNIVASIEARAKLMKDHSTLGYLTDNTYLISFTPTGEEKYQRTIYKTQSGLPEFVGHVLIASKNNAFIIYNDHAENITISPESKNIKEYHMKNAMVVVVEIDENGKVIKYPFSKDPTFSDFNISIADFVQLKDNLFFASTNRRKSIINVINRNVVLEFE